MAKVALETFGCRLNQYDTELLREDFESSNFSIVNPEDNPDIFVINTCTVTGRANRQARNLVRRRARMNPQSKIVVTGCYAEAYPEELKAINGVTLIPNRDDIVKFFNLEAQKFITRFKDHTRAFVKVQEGCDEFCTYCIVPYVRGKPRSRETKEIIHEIKSLAQRGYNDFVLTGTNIGKYNNDDEDLVNLLEKIEALPCVRRMDLGSIEPLTITPELIKFARISNKFANHFHISLQSGDNSILKRMERGYTAPWYEELINEIWAEIPGVSIGTDVIVGFPGEGEKEFMNTYNFIDSLPFTYLHVFRYSPRQRTKAAEFEEMVNQEMVKNRAEMLRQLGIQKSLEFRKKLLGKEVEVHVESKLRNGWLVGITSNYIKVLFKGPSVLKSEFAKVKITEVDLNETHGTLTNG